MRLDPTQRLAEDDLFYFQRTSPRRFYPLAIEREPVKWFLEEVTSSVVASICIARPRLQYVAVESACAFLIVFVCASV
jgi:hypothetical protein